MGSNSYLAIFCAIFLILNAVAEAQQPQVEPRICHKNSTMLTADCKSKAACNTACLGEDNTDAFTGTCIQEFTTAIVKGICRSPTVIEILQGHPRDQKICAPDTTVNPALPTKRCVCSSVCSASA